MIPFFLSSDRFEERDRRVVNDVAGVAKVVVAVVLAEGLQDVLISSIQSKRAHRQVMRVRCHKMHQIPAAQVQGEGLQLLAEQPVDGMGCDLTESPPLDELGQLVRVFDDFLVSFRMGDDGDLVHDGEFMDDFLGQAWDSRGRELY